jgi:hypothetical protein
MRTQVHDPMKLSNMLMSLFLMWFVDALSMAYLYKQYFGRFITHEMDIKADEKYVYDAENHKYIYSPELEIQNKMNQKIVENAVKSGENVLRRNMPFLEKAADDKIKMALLLRGINVPNAERYAKEIRQAYRRIIPGPIEQQLPDEMIQIILGYLI